MWIPRDHYPKGVKTWNIEKKLSMILCSRCKEMKKRRNKIIIKNIENL